MLRWADTSKRDYYTVCINHIKNGGGLYNNQTSNWELSEELREWLKEHKIYGVNVISEEHCYDTILIPPDKYALFKLTWL